MSSTAGIVEQSYECIQCGKVEVMRLDRTQWERWQGGELIQRCFPQLSDDQREIMISHICGVCFDKITEEPDEPDEDDISEGAACPEPDCDGYLVLHPVVNCSCHVMPPCDQCVNNPLTCPECGWESEKP